MMSDLSRRRFLQAAGASAMAYHLAAPRAARARQVSPSETVVAGVMGTGGRGTSLSRVFQSIDGVEVGYVCDVDEGRAAKAAATVGQLGGQPKAVTDYRRILDDAGVDVLVVATCNHWHAPAAILGCAAGKHVYVEKPCSHNPREGELMVEAARKYNRQVQMGNQRRSWPGVIEATRLVREGVIGRPYLAQTWYTNLRDTIGRGTETSPPPGLDYDLWQGPAPRRPFRDNILHYNWHWFWHWGNGELGNNGIHMLDVCRWGLGVELPTRVSSLGGRYRYEDDQETPDTNMVTYDFPDRKTIIWHGTSCNRPPVEKPYDIVFQGEDGSLAISGANYQVFDQRGRPTEQSGGGMGNGNEKGHIENLIAAIRTGAPLNSDIETAATSTLLCHLGNISYRVERTLHCDPATGKIQGDPEAMTFWQREYEPGWEPKV